MKPRDDYERQYFLQEFETLHKEIDELIKALREAEDRCVLSIGALWAWILSTSPARPAILLLPSILGALFFLKRRSIDLRIEQLGNYLRKQEADCDIKGWEHFNRKLSDPISKWSNIFYGVITGMSLVVGILLLCELF